MIKSKRGKQHFKLNNTVMDNTQDDFMLLGDTTFKVATYSEVQNTHHIHIKGEITEPENYVDLLNFLYTVPSNDEVNLHINSGGGNVDTANEIISAIQVCPAVVNGHIHGYCASAATGILLACHNYVVGEGATFMIHCVSAGYYGKLPDMLSHGDHLKRMGLNTLNNWYEGLLSKEEINNVSKGVDLWFCADEIRERLTKRSEYLNSQREDDLEIDVPKQLPS